MSIGSVLISYWLDKFHRIQPAYTTYPRHATAKFRLIKSTMHCQFEPAACDVSDMSGFIPWDNSLLRSLRGALKNMITRMKYGQPK